jgi:hypothetical protein
MGGVPQDVKSMLTDENRQANSTLDKLFKHVDYLKNNTQFVSVNIEECTLYIPVNNLNKEKVPSFREQFANVYNKSREEV